MEAVAHSASFAKKVGIKQSVGKDFAAADKGKKFGTGGGVGVTHGGKNQIGRQETRVGSVLGQQKNIPNINLNKYIGKKEGGTVALKKLFKGKETYGEELKEAKAIKSGKISPQEYAKGEKMEGHKKGGVMKETMGPKTMSKDVEAGSNKLTKFGQSAVQKRGMTKGTEEKGFKKEGLQGGAKFGKGTFGAAPIKMAKGGKVKRYDEGGELEGDGVSLGQNKNIGDDVRARAMAAMEAGGVKDEPSEVPPKVTPSLPSRKAFIAKANKAGFTADQTGGGAALMTRRDRKTTKPMYKAGGVTRGDGIAQKGKTKGKWV